MIVGENVRTLECLPYHFEQPSLPLVHVDFRDLTMSNKLKNDLHIQKLFDTKFYDSNEVLFPSIEKVRKT